MTHTAMTATIARLATVFMTEEPRLTQQAAIQAAMVSLGAVKGVSIHSIII